MHDAMRTDGEVKEKLHVFSISGVYVVSFMPGRFDPGKFYPSIHLTGTWLGPRTSMEAVDIIPSPCLESNNDSSAAQPSKLATTPIELSQFQHFQSNVNN
jgi:hypothetical protein